MDQWKITYEVLIKDKSLYPTLTRRVKDEKIIRASSLLEAMTRFESRVWEGEILSIKFSKIKLTGR